MVRTRKAIYVGNQEVQRRYIGNKLIFELLGDRDKVSGVVIFTDKADNSVVHVDVDGKSVQGDSTNLFDFSNTFTNNTYPAFKMQLKPYTKYTASTDAPIRDDGLTKDVFFAINEVSPSSASNGIWYGNPRTITTDSTGVVNIAIRKIDDTAAKTTIDDLLNRNRWVRIEEGSTASPFNGYRIPTPDYPIEIHNLNDFDVVSSVGVRNILLNSEKEIKNNDYNIKNYTPITPLVQGEEYTATICVTPARGVSSMELYLSVGEAPQSTFTFNGTSKQIITRTFTAWYPVGMGPEDAIVYANLQFFRFPNDGTVTEDTTIHWVKVEKGNESTPYPPAPEDISEFDNHPLIDKINLLLSEPLRSVGDVKDRLFRDSDDLWKVERNVGEEVLDGSSNIWANGTIYDKELTTNRYLRTARGMQSSTSRTQSSHLVRYTAGGSMWGDQIVGHVVVVTNQFHLNVSNNTLGVSSSDGTALRTTKFRNWLQSEYDKGTPVTIQYMLLEPYIETLDQELQDKLNNLRSFQGSNYVYTIINDISPTVAENLKPTLHATFKSKGWYDDYQETLLK